MTCVYLVNYKFVFPSSFVEYIMEGELLYTYYNYVLWYNNFVETYANYMNWI